jgi:hypothetical protein
MQRDLTSSCRPAARSRQPQPPPTGLMIAAPPTESLQADVSSDKKLLGHTSIFQVQRSYVYFVDKPRKNYNTFRKNKEQRKITLAVKVSLPIFVPN